MTVVHIRSGVKWPCNKPRFYSALAAEGTSTLSSTIGVHQQIWFCTHLCLFREHWQCTLYRFQCLTSFFGPIFFLSHLHSDNRRTAHKAQWWQWDNAALPPGRLPPSDCSSGEVLQRPGPPQSHRCLEEPNCSPCVNCSCLLCCQGDLRLCRYL